MDIVACCRRVTSIQLLFTYLITVVRLLCRTWLAADAYVIRQTVVVDGERAPLKGYRPHKWMRLRTDGVAIILAISDQLGHLIAVVL